MKTKLQTEIDNRRPELLQKFHDFQKDTGQILSDDRFDAFATVTIGLEKIRPPDCVIEAIKNKIKDFGERG